MSQRLEGPYYAEARCADGTLGAAGEGILRQLFADEARDGVEGSFGHVSRVLDEVGGQPFFFFDHVLSPHPPFLFHTDGSPVALLECYLRTCPIWSPIADKIGLSADEYRDRVRDQLAYINGRTLAAVHDIIDRDPEAVIVVFSDHGTRHDLADRLEMFESFLAARTPGHPDLFGQTPSPVNYLPTLLNAYLGTDLPLRDYRSWDSTGLVLDLVERTPTPATQ